jgi:hypothetical protein
MTELRDIPFLLDAELLMRQQHIAPGTEFARIFTQLVTEVQAVARPKAIYEVSYVDEKADDSVVVSGVRFASRTLRKNLEHIERVFPYVATCGTEADTVVAPGNDVIGAYWLWTLKQVVLTAAIEHLREHIQTRYRIVHSSTMNPGSGDADVWPIEQQKELFSLFAGAEECIGVKLMNEMLMIPTMSESGILFPAEVGFESCQICHRERCPNRKAPFDEELWRTMHAN